VVITGRRDPRAWTDTWSGHSSKAMPRQLDRVPRRWTDRPAIVASSSCVSARWLTKSLSCAQRTAERQRSWRLILPPPVRAAYESRADVVCRRRRARI